MAGGFPGMPLGSFSGRGSDFSPFQFTLQMRQRALEQEQARKLQQAAMQQSFTMALMQKKQEEAQLAQQAQQFQASQQARAAEKQMAAEQFRAEQDRLREAERAQNELRRLGEERQAAQERRLQSDRDAEVAAVAERRGLQTKGAEAMAWVETSATAPYALNLEQLGDPLKALDATEAWLLHEAQKDPDPQRRAAAVAQVRVWRKNKQDEVEGAERLRGAAEYREGVRSDRAEGRRLQSERDRVNKIAKANKPIEDEIERLQKRQATMAAAAAAFKGQPEGKSLEDEIARLDGEIEKLRKKLTPLE